MTIDFVSIADRFGEPLADQTRSMPRIFATLAKTYERWGREVRAAERQVAGIPVIRFRDGAVGVRVTRVRSTAAFDVGADLAAGGEQFMRGLGIAVTAVEQELLIPGLLGVGRRFAQRFEQRTERMMALDPSIFAATDSSFLDLPALGVLAVQTVADAGFLDRPAGEPATQSSTSGAPGAGSRMPSNPIELVDLFTGAVVGVVLVLPVATTLITGHVRIVSTSYQLQVVDRLVEVEHSLRGVRGTVLESLYEALDASYVLEYWIAPFAAVIEVDLLVITLLGPQLVGSLLRHVGGFVDAVNAVSELLVPMLDLVLDIWEFFMNMDLLPGIPGVSLTIGEVLDGATFVAARTTMAGIGGNLIAVTTPVSPVARFLTARDIRIFRNVGLMFLILAGHSVPSLSTPAPPGRVVRMPDIVGNVLSSRLEGVVTGFLGATGGHVRDVMTGTLDETAGAATDLGRLAEQAIDRTSHGVRGLTDAATSAATWAAAAFGDEVDRERAGASARAEANATDPVLQLASTGLSVAGGLIPHYVGGMRRFLSRREVRATPVSPQVLAQHGRLVGVRSERLTVRLAPDALDTASATTAADLVRAGLRDIYDDGRRTLDDAVGVLTEVGSTPSGRPAAVVGAGR